MKKLHGTQFEAQCLFERVGSLYRSETLGPKGLRLVETGEDEATVFFPLGTEGEFEVGMHLVPNDQQRIENFYFGREFDPVGGGDIDVIDRTDVTSLISELEMDRFMHALVMVRHAFRKEMGKVCIETKDLKVYQTIESWLDPMEKQDLEPDDYWPLAKDLSYGNCPIWMIDEGDNEFHFDKPFDRSRVKFWFLQLLRNLITSGVDFNARIQVFGPETRLRQIIPFYTQFPSGECGHPDISISADGWCSLCDSYINEEEVA